jgi:hypothetical protein
MVTEKPNLMESMIPSQGKRFGASLHIPSRFIME